MNKTVIDLAYPPKEMEGMTQEEMIAHCEANGYSYFQSIKG